MKIALGFLRGIVKLKPVLGQILLWITLPFRAVGRFLFRAVLIPSFRLILLMRRRASDIYLPAKNRLLFIFSNRFAIHAAVAVIAIFAVVANLRPTAVHAANFSQQSVLDAMLNANDPNSVEVVVTTDTQPIKPRASSYSNQVVLSNEPAGASADVLFGEADTTNQPVSSNDTTDSTESNDSVSGAPNTDSTPVATRSAIETYTVQDGDTISSIAHHFGLNVTTILWANGLSVKSTIHPGATLTILPVDGVTYKIAKGDTLSRIAQKYSVDSNDILQANALADADALRLGQTLIIPGGVQQAAPTVAKRPVASVGAIFAPSPSSSVPASSAAGSKPFIWPTDQHRINTYFGQYYIFGRHTGLDINCTAGKNTNRAAADGIVIFAGWNTGGYGNLVKIDHGNGLISYYGHNAKLYVHAGQEVSQGDPVGLCGTTGRSTGPHLHFEVRKNNVPVNPLPYLPKP